MKIETFLAIVAIAGIVTSTVLAVKLKEARHPIIINCGKPVNPVTAPDRSNPWEMKI